MYSGLNHSKPLFIKQERQTSPVSLLADPANLSGSSASIPASTATTGVAEAPSDGTAAVAGKIQPMGPTEVSEETAEERKKPIVSSELPKSSAGLASASASASAERPDSGTVEVPTRTFAKMTLRKKPPPAASSEGNQKGLPHQLGAVAPSGAAEPSGSTQKPSFSSPAAPPVSANATGSQGANKARGFGFKRLSRKLVFGGSREALPTTKDTGKETDKQSKRVRLDSAGNTPSVDATESSPTSSRGASTVSTGLSAASIVNRKTSSRVPSSGSSIARENSYGGSTERKSKWRLSLARRSSRIVSNETGEAPAGFPATLRSSASHETSSEADRVSTKSKRRSVSLGSSKWLRKFSVGSGVPEDLYSDGEGEGEADGNVADGVNAENSMAENLKAYQQTFWKYHVTKTGKDFVLTTQPGSRHRYCRVGPSYFVFVERLDEADEQVAAHNRSASADQRVPFDASLIRSGFQLSFFDSVSNKCVFRVRRTAEADGGRLSVLVTESETSAAEDPVGDSRRDSGGSFFFGSVADQARDSEAGAEAKGEANAEANAGDGTNPKTVAEMSERITQAVELPMDFLDDRKSNSVVLHDPSIATELKKLHRYELRDSSGQRWICGPLPRLSKGFSGKHTVKGLRNTYFLQSVFKDRTPGSEKQLDALQSAIRDQKIVGLFRRRSSKPAKQLLIRLKNKKTARNVAFYRDVTDENGELCYYAGDGLVYPDPPDDEPGAEGKLGWLTVYDLKQQFEATPALWETVVGLTLAVGLMQASIDFAGVVEDV